MDPQPIDENNVNQSEEQRRLLLTRLNTTISRDGEDVGMNIYNSSTIVTEVLSYFPQQAEEFIEDQNKMRDKELGGHIAYYRKILDDPSTNEERRAEAAEGLQKTMESPWRSLRASRDYLGRDKGLPKRSWDADELHKLARELSPIKMPVVDVVDIPSSILERLFTTVDKPSGEETVQDRMLRKMLDVLHIDEGDIAALRKYVEHKRTREKLMSRAGKLSAEAARLSSTVNELEKIALRPLYRRNPRRHDRDNPFWSEKEEAERPQDNRDYDEVMTKLKKKTYSNVDDNGESEI